MAQQINAALNEHSLLRVDKFPDFGGLLLQAQENKTYGYTTVSDNSSQKKLSWLNKTLYTYFD